jgi:dTDP-4-dehydrorhamnose 3,5-epimerase
LKFVKTALEGVFLIELELLKDERGFFARSYCAEEFLKNGLNPQLAQCNISYNQKKGTLRGMHFQEDPYREAKLVRCIRGSIFDVVIDLRRDSRTFEKWIGIELSDQQPTLLYIPEGCAHGFQTLEDKTELFYQMSYPYVAEAARGLRWNDPYFNIHWPVEEKIISLKDQHYPLYTS